MEFRILGSFEVVGSAGFVDVRGSKRRGLLAYLVAHAGQPMSTDRLVEELWGDGAASGAARTVQTYVSQLRKLLHGEEARLETRPGGYVLEIDRSYVDAVTFQRAVMSAGAEPDPRHRLAALDQALALWRGPPLEEFGGCGWADREAVRLEALHIQALKRRYDALLDLGRAGDAAAELEDQVGAHRLDERFWAQFMLALYRTGRQADALGAYQEARRYLVDELGVEPGPELVDLEHRILEHDPTLLGDAQLTGDERCEPGSSSAWYPRTFLLTDIVDSVALWERDSSRMSEAVARHDAIIEGSVGAAGGKVVRNKGEGDSTFSVFASPAQAVAAAVAVQRAVAVEQWPTALPLRVRAGVHTGDAEPRHGDWYGPAVNRAARLRSLAGGGQTLATGVTAGLVADRLPDGVSLLHRGRRVLRGIERPEEVWELVAADDPRLAVPAPETLDTMAERISADRAGTAVPTAVPFVGRDAMLSVLHAAWERCSDGAEHVLVTGPAGIGKTTLVSHFARALQPHGGKVLWGVCEPEMMLPFQPWIQAVRPVAAAVAHRLGPLAADLALALPLPGVEPIAARAGDETLRHRLCEALLAVLGAVSDGERLCIVIDDFHWADPLTTTMIRFIARHGGELPLLLIVAGRHGDATEWPEPIWEHVEVGSLKPKEVAALVKACLPTAEMSDAEIDRLAYAAAGNPFFAVELARAAQSECRESFPPGAGLLETLPRSVQAILARRVRGLSRDCRDLLAMASVLGEEIAIDDLSQLAGRTAASVLEGLQSAVDAAVVRETPILDRFRFEHDLIRRHLLSCITASRRAHLHLATAELRRSETKPEAIVERAVHLAAAGELVAVQVLIDSVLAAGAVLQTTGGFEQAGSLYDYALNVAQTAGKEEGVARLLAARAKTLTALDRPYEAHEALDRAASLARTLQAAAVTVETALALSVFDPQVVPSPDKVDVLRQAVRLLRDRDSMERVRALNQLSLIEGFLGNQDVAQGLLDEAEQCAERLGTASARVHVSHARHVHGRAHGEPVATTVRRSRQAITLASTADDPQVEALARGELVTSALEAGDLALARVALSQYSALVARTRDPMARWIAATGQAVVEQAAGDLDLSDRLAAEALELGNRLDVGVAGVGFGAHLVVSSWLRGSLGAIAAQVEAVAEGYADLPIWAMALAFARAEAGDRAGARSAFERVGRLDELVDDVLRPGTLVLAGDVLFALGDRSEAAVLRDLLAPFEDRFVVVATTFALLGPVQRSLALLESLIGTPSVAIELLVGAASLCRDRGINAWANQSLRDARQIAHRNDLPTPPALGGARPTKGRPVHASM
jgi:DNA-binding SARP family transcriptional activator/class 3 adenylate cyclase